MGSLIENISGKKPLTPYREDKFSQLRSNAVVFFGDSIGTLVLGG